MRIHDTGDLWWKNAVIYCLDVETFMDWNDDGIGDLPGLVQRIDHLADRISELVAIGFDAVYLHQVATDPAPSDEKHDDAARTATPRSATLDAFVDMAAEHLLPQLKQVTA